MSPFSKPATRGTQNPRQDLRDLTLHTPRARRFQKPNKASIGYLHASKNQRVQAGRSLHEIAQYQLIRFRKLQRLPDRLQRVCS